MNNKQQPVENHDSLNIGDVYFVLFKHKWIVITFAVLGVLAAGAILIIKPPRYESEAKLYVQYVPDVKTVASTTGGENTIKQTDANGGNIILTELEFLNSLDLAQQVAEHVGPEKILARYGGGSDTNAAAAKILQNLVAEPALRTPSIIDLSFQHPDAEIARDVLREIIDAYIVRSAEQHRTIGNSEEFLTEETGHLREKLAATETELSAAKREAGIISTLEETRKSWNNENVTIEADLMDDGLKLAMYNGGVVEPAHPPTPTPTTEQTNQSTASNALAAIPESIRKDYQRYCSALETANGMYNQALMKYPEGSPMLKDAKDLVANFESKKAAIEKDYPDISKLNLPVMVISNPQGGQPVVGASEAAQVNQLIAQTNYLAARLVELHRNLTNLAACEPHINELQHRKDYLEAALTGFLASLEQNRMTGEQNLAGGIKITESPTPAAKKWPKSVKKLAPAALGGGLIGGIVLAFLLEMVIDRTVKRPNEIEKKLRLPLFISIPDTNQNGHRSLPALAASNRPLLKEVNGDALVPANGSGKNGHAEELAPWDKRHPLHRFYGGLRDRLIVNFEVRNLTHNPKLVGVTSCGKGAGVSSVAAGLAASLSESGDGNVLLVDMRAEQGAAQHFHKGKPGCGLDVALESETKKEARAQGHSHTDADDESDDGEIPSVLSKRFAKLMPKLKASDYDYIIFDMPPVSQTSITPRLAGLMDMVLLVIESEKTHRDSVQRATALLHESRAQVSTVLNKVKTYVPASLHQEVLDDEV